MAERRCAWCRGPIGEGRRPETLTCSKSCRQAKSRFGITVGRPTTVVDGHPRRLCYADPPYPGLARRYYGDHRDYAGEVDHEALIASLTADYDAWALSTSARALPSVLRLCPPDARVAAWVRGGRVNKDAQGPVTSWEPVIYAGAVARIPSTRRVDQGDTTPRFDSLVAGCTARTTDPNRVTGAKPAAFARWVFQLLDAQPGDEMVDMFPGSGGIARAWEHYVSSRPAAATGRAVG